MWPWAPLSGPRRGSAMLPPIPKNKESGRVRDALEAAGTRVFAGHLDVRHTGTIRDFIRAAEAECGLFEHTHQRGRYHGRAAGMRTFRPLWDKIIDTNLTGAFRMTRELLPGMIARKWGRIINIGSTAASVGWKDNPAYCASKSGLLGLTRCVALEGAPHGVSCVMISPTWVETELMRRNVEQVIAREGKGRTLEDAMADIAAQNPQQRIIQPLGDRLARSLSMPRGSQGHHRRKHPDHGWCIVVIAAGPIA